MENQTSNIEILIPERLAFWGELVDLPLAAIAALQAMAMLVRQDAVLSAAFEDFYEKTVLRGEWHREWSPVPIDPEVASRCGESVSLYQFLGYLSALPHTWEHYQRLGIELEVFKATMLDLRFYLQDYFDQHATWGYDRFGWIWRHLTVELFRLGRLQYMLMPFSGGVRALRRKPGATPEETPPSTVLLADPDLPLREDGYAWGAGRPKRSDIPPESESTWRPSFDAQPEGWRGHLVSPHGRVQREPTWLSVTDWELILDPGDTIIDMHIPRSDALNSDTCGSSYAQALKFFAKIFPDRPSKALYCHTWIFSPQLQEFLPQTSNLVKFQREFYLYPHPGTPGYLWSFVFGDHQAPAGAPRDTSLRRAVLDCLEGDGEIFDLPGLMFHAPDAWGTQPYMGLR